MGAILGGHPAVVDSLGAVVGGLGVGRGSSGAFACRLRTLSGGAIAGGPVEITRRVTRFGLSVTLLGISVTNVRGQVAVATFYVSLAWRRQGVRTLIRPASVLTWERRAACLSFGHMSRSRAVGGRTVLQRQAGAITNAAIYGRGGRGAGGAEQS
jgi:hypothetical protein